MNENTKNLFKIFRTRNINVNKTKLLSDNKVDINKSKKYNDIELVKHNAERERKELAKEMGISLKSSWKEIVKKNDELIEKDSIRIK